MTTECRPCRPSRGPRGACCTALMFCVDALRWAASYCTGHIGNPCYNNCEDGCQQHTNYHSHRSPGITAKVITLKTSKDASVRCSVQVTYGESSLSHRGTYIFAHDHPWQSTSESKTRRHVPMIDVLVSNNHESPIIGTDREPDRSSLL